MSMRHCRRPTLKNWRLVLLAASVLPLGGCVAGMVASAAGMAVEASQKPGAGNAELRPAARSQCQDYAAKYGTVHIIDVAQHRIDKIIVWGTVDDGKSRRSFECGFTTKISSFKLRPIRSAQ